VLPVDDVTTPTLPLPEGFISPDTRNVTLQPVVAKPKKGTQPDPDVPNLPMEGGQLTLRGTVFGPDGPVGGAVVRVERYAGGLFGRRDVTTNKDGRYEVTELVGGRTRVRAWKDDLATTESQLGFLASTGEATLDVAVERHNGQGLSAALTTATPVVGQPATLRAVFYQEQVNPATGIVEGTGIGATELLLGIESGYRVENENPRKTGDDGAVEWQMVCTSPGVHNVVVSGGGQAIPVQLPECKVPDSGGDASPVAPPFAVGDTFTPPRRELLPAGTYTATTPGACTTSVESIVDGQWSRSVRTERVLTFGGVTREWAAADGTAPCTFRRTA
jgi:hypothetical protein